MVREIIRWIEGKWRLHQPATHRELREFIGHQWGVFVLPNTLCHIVAGIDGIRSCTAFPMEVERMNVPDQAVYHWFSKLRDRFRDLNVPAHFVFNMDEMGHQDYADAKEKTCIVPRYVTEKQYYEVSRRGKRITLIACIAADGSCLRSALIIHRATYETEIQESGLTEEKLRVYCQSHAFIDHDIFLHWLKDTFLPALSLRRLQYDYRKKKSVTSELLRSSSLTYRALPGSLKKSGILD
jgi:hypothetical protein